MEQSEDAFLKALAERPFDRTLRLIFSDWLLERQDPRGEAIALFEAAALTGPSRRRLAKLQQDNGRKWLGPLADVVVSKDCKFAGGLLSAVRFPANVPAEHYAALAGEPRLATVESLAIQPGRVASALGTFLAHPVLARVVDLEGDVGTLAKAEGFSCHPEVLKIALWNPREDLEVLAACVPLQAAATLRLSTIEFVLPEFADELADVVVASGALEGRKRLQLFARQATFEGLVQWLRVGAQRVKGAARGKLQRWSVDWNAETQFGLEGDAFEIFTIDALATDARESLSVRIGTAAAILSMLDGIGLKRVEVRHIPGGRLSKDELNTLRAALRRLKSLEEFWVCGVPYPP